MTVILQDPKVCFCNCRYVLYTPRRTDAWGYVWLFGTGLVKRWYTERGVPGSGLCLVKGSSARNDAIGAKVERQRSSRKGNRLDQHAAHALAFPTAEF